MVWIGKKKEQCLPRRRHIDLIDQKYLNEQRRLNDGRNRSIITMMMIMPAIVGGSQPMP